MLWTTGRARLLLVGGGLGLLCSTQLLGTRTDVPLTGMVRFARTGLVVAGIGWDYQRTLYSGRISPADPEYPAVLSAVHKRSAEKLLALCCRNGGVFIKVGQHIGAWDYLVPQEYVDTLKVLHSRAPKYLMSDVFLVLREDLKRDPKELFSEFDSEPLGTASLAQVHRAVLKEDGRQVAVKVQHPKVKAYAEVDMKTMEGLVNVVSWLFPDFKFKWLVEETKRNLPQELDFLNEGRNADRLRGVFRDLPWLKIPEICWELSTRRVLTMEFCRGGQVDDLSYLQKERISCAEVSSKLGQLYAEMIFVRGMVHCDPHPGNILVAVAPNGQLQLALLDHGLYLEMSDHFRWTYSRLWHSIMNADIQGIREACRELNVEKFYGIIACMVTARPWSTIVGGIKNKEMSSDEMKTLKSHVGNYLPEISKALNSVPREMLLLFKTNDLLRGVDSALKIARSQSSLVTLSRCCVKSIYGERLRACSSAYCRLRTRLQERWEQTKISLFQLYLWLTTSWILRNS